MADDKKITHLYTLMYQRLNQFKVTNNPTRHQIAWDFSIQVIAFF